MPEFIGREAELKELNQLLGNTTANLVIIRGRRRIGKSRLIKEFAKSHKFYAFEGIMPHPNITVQHQRDVFARSLEKYFGLPGLKADNWSDLFELLAQQTQKGRTIISMDEISWMAQGEPDFLGKLKIIWDQNFSKNSRLVLILCSSISPWIEKNLVGSTGYLGRPTLDLTLQELSLPTCNQFIKRALGDISAFEKLKLLSVTGGIPRYLELLNRQMTADENIQNLFFNQNSPLFDEFNYIFADIYSTRNVTFKKIIKQLVNSRMSQKEISDAANISQTGDLSEYLHDLELGGFIARDFTWSLITSKISKLSTYRLKDNYTRFYLRYIEPNRERIKKGLLAERAVSTLPSWDMIIGLQFENLVVNNHRMIIQKLNIRPELIVFANPYFQRQRTRSDACQIDYLIQTRESAYVCEIKFSRNKIGSSIISEVDSKLKKLRLPKYMSRRAVLIHVNGITDTVKDSLFFTKIIAFDDLIV